jgi:flavorubredoxin
MPILEPYKAAEDTWVLPSYLPVAGFGNIVVNSHLILAREPVLVDTGMPVVREEFLAALWSLVEPRDLRWIMLTHDDGDHTGALAKIMEAAPQAPIVTQYIGFARLETALHLDPHRFVIKNPGEGLPLGDRTLQLLRPPLFDSPATTAIFDPRSRVLFSADSFGAFIPEVTQDVGDIAPADYAQGFGIFNYANHPWSVLVDRAKFDVQLEAIRRLDPAVIASCHSPMARGRTAEHLAAMARIPDSEPLPGPDQQAFQAFISDLEHDQSSGVSPAH